MDTGIMKYDEKTRALTSETGFLRYLHGDEAYDYTIYLGAHVTPEDYEEITEVEYLRLKEEFRKKLEEEERNHGNR